MSNWRKFGGTDDLNRNIIASSAIGTGVISEIESNILRIGNIRLKEDQQNGIWFRGLGHSNPNNTNESSVIALTSIEERYYNTNTGDCELLLYKAKDINNNLVNPFVDPSYNLNDQRGDRVRILAPTINFDTYNVSLDPNTVDINNETYKNETTRVIIDQNGFVGINTITPGQVLDVVGKFNIQSATNKSNIYISNFANPDPANLGSNNIGIGAYIFSHNDYNASNNIVLGEECHRFNKTASSNISLGNLSQNLIDSGTNNLSFGHSSSKSLTSGSFNISIGNESLKNTNNFSNIIAIGHSSLRDLNNNVDYNAIYDYNISIGNLSGQASLGGYNSFIGHSSGLYSQSNRSLAFGYKSLYNSYGDDNIAIGYESLAESSLSVGNTTFHSNSFIGNYSGSILKGTDNCGLGYKTQQISTGNRNISFGSHSLMQNNGSNNIAIGYSSNTKNGGSSNVSIGTNSLNLLNISPNIVYGSNNTVLGSYSGSSLTGSNNTCIGSYSNTDIDCNQSIAIGYRSLASTSNSIVFGDPDNDLIKIGLGTSSPEYSIDVRNNLYNSTLNLNCGYAKHSDVLFSRNKSSNVNISNDVPTNFYMRYNTPFDTSFSNVLYDDNNNNLDYNLEEKFNIGFEKDNFHLPMLTFSNLNKIGLGITNPTIDFDVFYNSRFQNSLIVNGNFFSGNIDSTSSYYDNINYNNYFNDKSLFIGGFDVIGNVVYNSVNNTIFNSTPSFNQGVSIANNATNSSYSLLLEGDAKFVGSSTNATRSHLLINTDINVNLREHDLYVNGTSLFESKINTHSLNVTDDKALFQKAIDVSGGISTFGNICSFDSTGVNNRCIFHPGSTLDICGNFNLGNFSTPGFQTSVIRSQNDVGNNVQLNIYDDYIDSTDPVLDISGYTAFSFGSNLINTEQLVQIRSKDPRAGDNSNFNRFLITSENVSHTSQLMLGSCVQATNVFNEQHSFLSHTHAFKMYPMNKNDLNIINTDAGTNANFIFEPSGVLFITANNSSDTSVLLDVNGSSSFKNINTNTFTGNNIVVNNTIDVQDLSCNTGFIRNLNVANLTGLVDVSFSTDLALIDINSETLSLTKTFNMGNMLSFDNSTNNISFLEADIDISSSTNKYFNVRRDLNVIDSNLNVSGGMLNISGDVFINGVFTAENLEVNGMVTASGGFITDFDCLLLDATTITSTNSNLTNLTTNNLTLNNYLNGINSRSQAGFYDISFTNVMEGVVGSKLNTFEAESHDLKVTNILEITNDTSAVHMTSQDISVNNNLDVSGTVSCDILQGRGITPVGGIIFWNGSSLDIPFNWNICLGNNNTPDLKSLMTLDPSVNITYYVRSTSNHGDDPHFIFSDNPASDAPALNNSSTPFVLYTGNIYTFIWNDNVITNHPFNIGTDFRVNNATTIARQGLPGIDISSTNTDQSTGYSIKNVGESLTFSIPHFYDGIDLKYYCYEQHGTNNDEYISDFVIGSNYTLGYIKRNS